MEVSEIVDSVDILEYISQFCELTEQADGEYWGLSPLKEENTPSFSVNPDIQRFYDFSSGKGGNVLDFICAYNGCEFKKGLAILKKYANISDNGEGQAATRLLASSIARKFKAPSKRQKESKCIVLPPEYMERFDINEDKLKEWEAEGIRRDALRKFQVRYDPFSDRLVFPIKNVNGEIINVCGRTLDPDYKEKKLRKYTYFKPLGILDTIYGLSDNKDAVLSKKEIILFEGAKSVMLAETWGIHNTGAILTSHLNPYQFQILIKLGVRIVFALDAEIDIREDKNIMKLRPYAPVEWVCNRHGLLAEKDAPVDKGLEVFQQLYDERRRLR
ncbi:CHC2 zinc finger domain-containing protein [Intestinimonas butyriciproducens]|uniref:CHC2 zinc finger domain-containing protein n=1 Tax=Intestinimonas butyriciproducens TaxID=1297617 RepID=UPI001898B964|nr:CHC2 zinc finger domain-containing protein [Intestinimonas butyriciproducens]MDB7829207.1 CHC2 zinc finger domain-containing protein [Intestinimonas butyriciproducens]